MNQQNFVPRLNLAPKLKRPLSLWKPLDYLHILYWVLFFPQALRWYIDTFGSGSLSDEQRNPQQEKNQTNASNFLRENPIDRRLFIQSFVLVFAINLLVFVMTGRICISIGIFIGTCLTYARWGKIAEAVAQGVAMNLGEGVMLFLLSPKPITLTFRGIDTSKFGTSEFNFLLPRIFAAFAIPLILLVLLIVLLVVSYRSNAGERFMSEKAKKRMEENWLGTDMTIMVAAGLGLGVGFLGLMPFYMEIARAYLPLSWALVIPLGIIFGLGITLFFSVPRPENWLVGSIFNSRSLENSNGFIPRVTPLPLPSLTLRLQR